MTMRELCLTAKARREYDWSHTSHVLCMLANVHRGPKDAPLRPRDFNPTMPPKKRPMVKLQFLKGLWDTPAK